MNERSFRIVTSMLLGLMVTAVLIGFVFILTIPGKIDQTQTNLACLSARNQVTQLEALTDISRTLGLPTTFEIPPLPEECL